jgi:hypothetical protein
MTINTVIHLLKQMKAESENFQLWTVSWKNHGATNKT